MKALVRALIRWSWLLLLCLLVGYFVGRLLAAVLQPTYQATAIVQLNAQSRTSQVVQPVAAYSTLVTSDSLLNPILVKYRGVDRTTLSKALVVTSDNSSQTISIQLTLPDAKEAAGLATDLAQALVAQQNAEIKLLYNKNLELLNSRIAQEQKTIDQLNQKIVQLSPNQTQATANATQIQQLQSQVTQQQQLQSQDINSRQTLITDMTLYSAPLSVVQAATAPTKPATLVGFIPYAPVALLVALILGFAAIAFIEPTVGRINGVYTLQKKISLPVFGSLRWTRPSPQQVPLRHLIESKSPYAEDCRVMMADVLFHAEEASARILAITGLKVRAGSSSIASELAALLAQSKRRVLLIDANLYNPTLHKRLGVSNDAGLAKMLEELRTMKLSIASTSNQEPVEIRQQSAVSMIDTRRVAGVQAQTPVVKIHQQRLNGMDKAAKDMPEQKILEMPQQGYTDIPHSSSTADQIAENFPFDSYILSTGIQNLYLLPAGKSSLNPTSLLSMPEMEHFLRWASKPIDFIVIDCPALIYAEAHVVGAQSDQTFVVVDATRDRLKQVENARQELMNTGVKVSGLIVNKLGRWI